MQDPAPCLAVPGSVVSKDKPLLCLLSWEYDKISLPLSPLLFSARAWKKKTLLFLCLSYRGEKGQRETKKLLGDFEEMHLTLLPYHSLLASLECVRKRQTWTTTPQNQEQWCRSALTPPFFPHLGNNAFEQDRLSKSLRFPTA